MKVRAARGAERYFGEERECCTEGLMGASKPDFTDPTSVVEGFIHQMHCWEALAGALSACAQARFRPGGAAELHPEEMRVSEAIRQIPPCIAAIYLTERDPAFVPSGSYSVPPEYDPATETVVRVAPKTRTQVVVETDRKAPYMGGLREYVLKKQGEVWLIDSVSATIGTKKQKVALV